MAVIVYLCACCCLYLVYVVGLCMYLVYVVVACLNFLFFAVLDNPAKFTDNFKFSITFECRKPLAKGACMLGKDSDLNLAIRLLGFCVICVKYDDHASRQILIGSLAPPDLEWKLVYVGSAESSNYDQVLDSVLVGPVGKGVSKFIFEVCFSCPLSFSTQWINPF